MSHQGDEMLLKHGGNVVDRNSGKVNEVRNEELKG
jgi:hypothetical protein